nr:MAG TPA: hypothetical protein [Caudoviricetes sp.]
MSDGIHIPSGTGGDEPGRTLRNLGESWEPLRRGPPSEPLRRGSERVDRWGV